MIFDRIEVAVVRGRSVGDTGVIGSANTVTLGFVMRDNLTVATDVIGMRVRSDEMVDTIDTMFIEIIEDALPTLSPITRVDQDSFIFWWSVS